MTYDILVSEFMLMHRTVCVFEAHMNVSILVTVDGQTWTTVALLLYSCRSIEQYVSDLHLVFFCDVKLIFTFSYFRSLNIQ